MSAADILTPPQLRLGSLRALAEETVLELREWLRHGISLWLHGQKPSVRLEAFAPILLNPREPGPLQLSVAMSDIISETGRVQFRWQLETALEEEIATWSYTDGVEFGVFLLELAGWYGCRRFERAARALMGRPIHLGPTARTELATALGFAICRRTSPEVALSLARRMSETRLGPQPVIAQIVAFAAAADPAQLPALLKEFLPGWQDHGYHNVSCRLLADQLVDRVGLAELAGLILSSDPQLDDLKVLLQAHRIELGPCANDMVEVADKLGGSVTLSARYLDVERARSVVKESMFDQFRRKGIGELVKEDELNRIESGNQ